MSRLATQEFYFNNYETADDVVAHIDKVDKQLLCKLTKQMLQSPAENITVAVVGPQPEQGYSEESLGNTISKFY